jgi:uncharacterized protein
VQTFPTDAQRLAERERPSAPVIMRQRWERLLFLHWRGDSAEVQRTLPPGLTVDRFDGSAWLGVVPFFMRDVRPACCPPLPGFSDFLELNVRTYVFDRHGRPGVWFYSLDCNQWLAVKAARTFFRLRYEHARMSAEIDGGRVSYQAQRLGTKGVSRYVYSGPRNPRPASLGTLDFFLIERYRLFSHDPRRSRLFSGRVWHEPYRIGATDVPTYDDRMLRLSGFDPRGSAPEHICAADPVDVRVFPPERIRDAS